MKTFKSLIIIVLMFVFSPLRGQTYDAFLDKIDFSDTTLIESEFMINALTDYLTQEQEKDLEPRAQMYNLILASDIILSRSVTSFAMYKFVYQYLIYGFSELGANLVIDYLMRMPYFEFVNANEEQRDEIMALAAKFERVKIGSKAPEIQSVTIFDKDLDLDKIDAVYVVVFFWSYSCPHCRDLIKELAGFSKKNKNVEIVTVCVSTDLKNVKRLLKKYRLDRHYNICDGSGWYSPIVDSYAVDETPAMFLLDKDKIILAKPFDIEELIKEIK